jgi:hypothetical protein
VTETFLQSEKPMPRVVSVTPVEELVEFIVERHNVYRRKTDGEPKPWTQWPILQEWRFCNVYRELDTETKWIAENWRRPHRADPDLWFAMVVARLVNWHDSLEELGYPVPWDAERFVGVLDDRRRRGEKVFTGAYMIHADRHFSGTKAAYLASEVLTPMWRDREKLRRIAHGTLAAACNVLTQYRDMGGFMAGQVIADLKYVEPLRSASDWHSWAISGPGSRRGLNRVLNRDKDTPWNESEWLRSLRELHAEIEPLIRSAKMRSLHAQDLQSCLCEVDKFERLRLGEGQPRSKYPGRS